MGIFFALKMESNEILLKAKLNGIREVCVISSIILNNEIIFQLGIPEHYFHKTLKIQFKCQKLE